MVANSVLSLMVAVLEEQDKHQEWLNQFSTRVLASLLQGKPSLVFAGTELQNSAKTLYGKAVLAVQMVVQLAKPNATDESVAVAESLFPELTKLIRTELMQSSKYQSCFPGLLQPLEVVLQTNYNATWSVSLSPLALMLQLQADQAETAEIVSILLRRHAEEPSASQQQAIEEAVGALIQGVGLEQFWAWISWKDGKKKSKHVISPHKAWLLPLLKTSAMATSTTPPNLEFFQTTILGPARQCDGATEKQRVVDL